MNGLNVLKSTSMQLRRFRCECWQGAVKNANLGQGQYAGYYAFQFTATLTSGWAEQLLICTRLMPR